MKCLLCGPLKAHKHGKMPNGYQRYFCPACHQTFTERFDTYYIGKDRTQRLERTNGIIRQQTGRWHRRQNKLGRLWEQTKVTTRLVVSYFNWIWQHSRFKTTAAQRAGLATCPWNWNDLGSFPSII